MLMSNAAIAMDGQVAVTPTALSWKYIRWGLGLFIIGFLTGFIPIAHYMYGAIAGDVGPDFLRNITLWWGCPAVLAELTLKTGGLGMVAIGFCYQAIIRQSPSSNLSSHERIAPVLCAFGLIATLVSAGAGYVICNYFWPNFFLPCGPGRKECVARGAGTQHSRLCGWRLLCIRRHPQSIGSISMTHLSGNSLTNGGSIAYRHAAAQRKQPRISRWLRQERRWPIIAWFSGIAAAALWIYSGMPMICH
jgi:hypothetical protein